MVYGEWLMVSVPELSTIGYLSSAPHNFQRQIDVQA